MFNEVKFRDKYLIIMIVFINIVIIVIIVLKNIIIMIKYLFLNLILLNIIWYNRGKCFIL